MYLEEAIVKHLISNATVSALVSSRVHWVKAPQNQTQPYVVIYKIDEEERSTLSGPSGLKVTTIQFTIVGDTFSSVVAVDRAIESAFYTWPINVTISTSPVVTVKLDAAVRRFGSNVYEEAMQGFYSTVRYDIYTSS